MILIIIISFSIYGILQYDKCFTINAINKMFTATIHNNTISYYKINLNI